MTNEERKAANAAFWAEWRRQSLDGGPFNIGLRKAWANYFEAHPEAIDELVNMKSVDEISERPAS